MYCDSVCPSNKGILDSFLQATLNSSLLSHITFSCVARTPEESQLGWGGSTEREASLNAGPDGVIIKL